MARVLVAPGLAVHAYAELPVRHLCDNGHDAKLLEPPAWRALIMIWSATASSWQLILIMTAGQWMC
jgi:hypothetical protein